MDFDVVVVGAGAAGMMCAAEAGKRGRSVLVVDHARSPGEKIRISGGGRCNFTNIHTGPENFLSGNTRFAISALQRYTARDFTALVERYGIAYHEKTLGQLFCDGSSRQIIDLLLEEMRRGGVELRLQTAVQEVAKDGEGFVLTLADGPVRCRSLVIATGGKSIPKMGATGWGYDIARRFGLRVTETRPGLVPLTFEAGMLERLKPLSGVAVDAVVSAGKRRFEEAMLFTHRGLSGPAILQISSYWREGEEIGVDLAPNRRLRGAAGGARGERDGRRCTRRCRRCCRSGWRRRSRTGRARRGRCRGSPTRRCGGSAEAVNGWRVKPVGSEGYRTAEVTLGGVETRDLDSRTMQAREVGGPLLHRRGGGRHRAGSAATISSGRGRRAGWRGRRYERASGAPDALLVRQAHHEGY
jgi:predicted Rossmann fold flavoprotein